MTTLKEKFTERISEDFQVLTKIVLKQMTLAIRLFEDNRNLEIHEEINNNEHIIDSLEVKMRDEVINSIVLYSPRAGELRRIMSYYDMTAYLERIGDLLLNVSGFMKGAELHGNIFPEFKEYVFQQIKLAQTMTQNALLAFTCQDSKLAKDTIILDDKVDALQATILNKMQTFGAGKMLSEQDMIDALCINSMAYNIERIGDNATNIAEAAIYLMEGRDVKHSNTIFAENKENI